MCERACVLYHLLVHDGSTTHAGERWTAGAECRRCDENIVVEERPCEVALAAAVALESGRTAAAGVNEAIVGRGGRWPVGGGSFFLSAGGAGAVPSDNRRRRSLAQIPYDNIITYFRLQKKKKKMYMVVLTLYTRRVCAPIGHNIISRCVLLSLRKTYDIIILLTMCLEYHCMYTRSKSTFTVVRTNIRNKIYEKCRYVILVNILNGNMLLFLFWKTKYYTISIAGLFGMYVCLAEYVMYIIL